MIPRRLGILRQMTLPASDDIEINKMVGLQIINKVPYSREDIIYDYSIIEKRPAATPKFSLPLCTGILCSGMALLAKREFIRKDNAEFRGIIKLAKLPKAKVPSDDKGLTVLINIDASDSEICFCQKQNCFSHEVFTPARAIWCRSASRALLNKLI